MRPLAVCVLLAGMLAAPAVGQLPDPAPLEWSITIDSPQTGQPGRFVELTCVSDGAAAIRWRIVGAEEDLIRVVDNGRRCLFVSPMPGEFRLVCAASRSDGALDLVETVVRIEGSRPTPGPGPTPTPKPPLPPGRFNLAQQVADMCNRAGLTKDAARRLSANYDAKASKAAAGAIRDVPTLLAETRTTNTEIIGADRERLLPTLFQPLADALSQAKPGDLAGHIDAWREIAIGFARGAE